MMNHDNTFFILETFKLLPLNGKIILNNFKIVEILKDKKITNLIKVLKNLNIKIEETKKIWFIDIKKLIDDTNLKIYYIPKESLEKLLINRNIKKLPDPLNYWIGISFLSQLSDLNKLNFNSLNENNNDKKTNLNKIRKTKNYGKTINLSLISKSPQNLKIKNTNYSPNFRINKNKFILKNTQI